MALPPIEWSPPDFVYRVRAEACLETVARGLGLAARVRRIRVRVLPLPAGDAARVAWIEGARADVRLVTDVGNFLTPDGRRALARLPLDTPLPGRRFSARATRALFLHELSHVRDGLAFGIDSNALPRGCWARFNEAWNVWIDGRLWRRGTPALNPSERWHEFRRTFPGARRRGRIGVHSRAVFDRLWRADVLTQRDLLEAVAALAG